MQISMIVMVVLSLCLLWPQPPLALATGSVASKSARISGGHNAVVGEAPWAVSIQSIEPYYPDDPWYNSHYGGGALIHPRWVLSAGHVVNLMGSNTCIRIGSLLSRSGGVRAHISHAFVHPSFDQDKLGFDIGLVRLEEPVAIIDSVKVYPVKLPIAITVEKDENGTEADWPPPEVTTVQVAGWGLHGNGSGVPNHLQVTKLSVMERGRCDQTLLDNWAAKGRDTSEVVPLPRDEMCGESKPYLSDDGQTTETGRTCIKDSGSPVVVLDGNSEGSGPTTGTTANTGTLVGVVARGTPCFRRAHVGPGMFTRVRPHLGWIRGHMGEDFATLLTSDGHQ